MTRRSKVRIWLSRRFSPAHALKRLMLASARAYALYLPEADPEKLIRQAQRAYALSFDHSARLAAILGDTKVTNLDVGARYGLQANIARYARFFDSYLCEPEPDEASRLREAGFTVIEKGVAGAEGAATLYEVAKISSSGLLRPSRLSAYFSAPWKSQVVKEVPVETTTVEEIAREYGTGFDLIKLDTQGTEYEILSAMGPVAPLLVQTEISLLPLYEGQKTFYDVVALMRDKGYLLADLSIAHRKPTYLPGSLREARWGRGVPIHGDVVFAPDWTLPAGRALIEERDRQYAALMLIYGLESMLRVALHELEVPHSGAIRDALALPAPAAPRA